MRRTIICPSGTQHPLRQPSAHRYSKQFDDRVTGIRGPDYGAVVFATKVEDSWLQLTTGEGAS